MSENFQDNSLDTLVRTNDVIYEVLPAEEIIRRILASYTILPKTLGETSDPNTHANESQERLYKRQFFEVQK